MAGVIGVQRSGLKRFFHVLNRRFVSTSKRNNDSAVVNQVCKTDAKSKAVEQRDWIPYGFDYETKAGDRNAMHSIMFISVTVCLTVGGFYWAYLPDYNLRDWAQREAFLELRRREQNGLPLVDPNYISPDKIILPSDEDLGDTEIII